ncbi:Arv1-domain-containing protein [Ceraceosorus guamensis]|uniref:Protein ARV n=1 Tax=Ceraceosorus guamensis TaxID=1522189 RepID=A0A316VSR0_9BASI|nr:Arv1-domain-containing protein [Ceraceosorus guamensis]PWN40522.1 Arv1-domain-containing protein [Ceraceosorus guamensis]
MNPSASHVSHLDEQKSRAMQEASKNEMRSRLRTKTSEAINDRHATVESDARGRSGSPPRDLGPVCVHCSAEAASLYLEYSPGHVALTPCNNCHSKAVDPYVEFELPIILLDLVLVKPSAYRHLIFNRHHLQALPLRGSRAKAANASDTASSMKSRSWRTLRQGTALVLVDAYVRWHDLCLPSHLSVSLPATLSDLLHSYLSVLAAVALEAVVFHSTIHILCLLFLAIKRQAATWASRTSRSGHGSRIGAKEATGGASSVTFRAPPPKV